MSAQCRINLGVGLGIGVGVLSIAGFAVWWKNKKEQIPTRWRRVGELSELMCFPIKSAGPVYKNDLDCTVLGLEEGNLRDRVFMVVTVEGQFITGRMHPKLVLIKPTITGGEMKLSAPNMEDIVINIEELKTKDTSKAAVFGQPVDTVDCGDEASEWFSKYLLNDDAGVRLVFYPHNYSQRFVSERNKVYKQMNIVDSGALHDGTSYNLINQASLDDLNKLLEKEDPLSALQFRPNFVVKGGKAYDEDNWNWVQIGDTIFRVLKPCDRCMFTTINPITAARDKTNEPLATLRKYRLIPEAGKSPILGIHLGIRVPGRVKIGDPIYVDDRS